MNRPVFASALLGLALPVLAQGSITTPPGGLTKEGPHAAYAFGWFADARYQQADGMHLYSGQRTITEIAFRADNRSHTADTAMGRTWTRVTLDISETRNYDTLSQVWSNNVTTTPNRVFDHKWGWPTLSGKPLLQPDVWGSATGRLRFPFTKPWAYTGKNEILMDYRFRGGSLANNGTWNFFRSAYYYLDSEVVAIYRAEGGVESLPETPAQCSDSGYSAPYAAATYGYSYAYGPANNEVTLKNTVQVTHYSYYTAPNRPVVQAMGLGGLGNAGVNIGARCNHLYVDLTKPVALLNMMTTGSNAYSGLVNWQMPWQSAFGNLKLHVQSAWADSKTGAFSLSSAVRLILPNAAPPTFLPRYKSLFSANPDSSRAAIEPATTGYYFPYTLYRTR